MFTLAGMDVVRVAVSSQEIDSVWYANELGDR